MSDHASAPVRETPDWGQRAAFTLIELLIVVLVITILAAIALPNFLEFQTRSKVSRALADMRSIATAVEAYLVDHDDYPANPPLNTAFYVTPTLLTTPTAYLATRPLDPFKLNRDVADSINPAFSTEDSFYDYYTIISAAEYAAYVAATGNDIFVLAIDASGPVALTANRGALEKYGRWLQWSIGPDALFWIVADDFNNPNNSSAGLRMPGHLPWGYSFDVPYDPTNGSVSFGNIMRCQKKPVGISPFNP